MNTQLTRVHAKHVGVAHREILTAAEWVSTMVHTSPSSCTHLARPLSASRLTLTHTSHFALTFPLCAYIEHRSYYGGGHIGYESRSWGAYTISIHALAHRSHHQYGMSVHRHNNVCPLRPCRTGLQPPTSELARVRDRHGVCHCQHARAAVRGLRGRRARHAAQVIRDAYARTKPHKPITDIDAHTTSPQWTSPYIHRHTHTRLGTPRVRSFK